MAHVPPHRWADAAQGRLSANALRAMEGHAAVCQSCADARHTVERARTAFADIRDAEPHPPLGWDHIGARIYWVTSSEQRRAARHRQHGAWRYFLAVPALASAAVAAVVAVLSMSAPDTGAPAPVTRAVAELSRAAESVPATEPVPGAPELPAPAAPLSGLVTFLQGDVRRGDMPLGFDAAIAAGDTLTTGRGRAAVQFDAASGFAVAESSAVEIVAFDERDIRLAVHYGEISVEVERRSAAQRFVVTAGGREVHVRGTAFRVTHRDGGLRVSCGHGRVVVMEQGRELSVDAGEVIAWQNDALRRDTAELSEIAAMQREVIRVPTWTTVPAMRATTASLAVSAKGESPVKIDGELVGSGSFTLRVIPGRHHVEAASMPGFWVESDAGAVTAARVKPVAPRASSAGKSQRRTELLEALSKHSGVQTCLWPLRKQGVSGSAHIELDIRILQDGTIAHLNIPDSNLPSKQESCIRHVVDQIQFSAGPAVTLHERISF